MDKNSTWQDLAKRARHPGPQRSRRERRKSAASAQPMHASSSDLGTVLFDFPAPGCPDKLPTYETVSHICTPLDVETCKSNHLCDWQKASTSVIQNRGALCRPQILI